MTNGSYFVDNRAVEGQKFIAQKVVAKITFCAVFEMTVYDCMNWNPLANNWCCGMPCGICNRRVYN